MKRLSENIVILVSILVISDAAKFQSKPLPKYITACKRSGLSTTDCGKNSANAAIPFLLKGDKEYKIPKLIPLKVPKMEVNNGNLKLTLTDVVIDGLEGYTVDELFVYPEKTRGNGYVKVSAAWLSVSGQYDIKGRIIVLDVSGSGPANLTFYDTKFKYSFDYDVYKKNDGKEYARITNSSTDLDVPRAYFNLENLLGEKNEVGIQINKVLNENSQEVVKELGYPLISELIQVIVAQVLGAVLNVVPYDELFPL